MDEIDRIETVGIPFRIHSIIDGLKMKMMWLGLINKGEGLLEKAGNIWHLCGWGWLKWLSATITDHQQQAALPAGHFFILLVPVPVTHEDIYLMHYW